MATNLTAIEMAQISKVVGEAVEAIADYAKEKEIQKTERRRITACLEALKKQIESDREKFELFLENSFEEREKIYSKVDDMLKIAVEKGDPEMAQIALNFILQVYNRNPLEGLDLKLDYSGSNLLLNNNIKNYLK